MFKNTFLNKKVRFASTLAWMPLPYILSVCSWWLEEFPFLVEPNDFTDYVYEDGPLADCEPGFPIDTDCIEAILNITLPFPPERDVTQITWDFERSKCYVLLDQ